MAAAHLCPLVLSAVGIVFRSDYFDGTSRYRCRWRIVYYVFSGLFSAKKAVVVVSVAFDATWPLVLLNLPIFFQTKYGRRCPTSCQIDTSEGGSLSEKR